MSGIWSVGMASRSLCIRIIISLWPDVLSLNQQPFLRMFSAELREVANARWCKGGRLSSTYLYGSGDCLIFGNGYYEE